MKRTVFFALTLIAALLLSSCATAKLQKEAASPLAIISVYANTTLPWYDADATNDQDFKVKQTDEGIVTGLLNKALDRNKEEKDAVTGRIDGAADALVTALENAGIELVDAETVTASKSYKNFMRTFVNSLTNTQAAHDYPVLTSVSKKLCKQIAQECGAQTMLYAQFRFEKAYHKEGLHVVGAKARVTLTINATDATGKVILSKSYTAESDEITPYRTGGSLDTEDLQAFYPYTIKKAVDKFLADFE